MNAASSRWLHDPENAYADWQEREAVGADRRLFSARSIVQHRAMFRRFLRFLIGRGVNLASFDATHVEAFFAESEQRFLPGTTTRLRYLKLLDRLSRQLIADQVRREHPVAELLADAHWPTTEPVPLYMPPDADLRLQQWAQADPGDDAAARRDKAIVAMLLATGVTAIEFRTARTEDLRTDGRPPYLHVGEHGPRPARTVALEAFAIPLLTDWRARRLRDDPPNALLFPGDRGPDVSAAALCRIVRQALLDVGFSAPDMSPRVLRNTWGRRRLLAGDDHQNVSRLMGLTSSRTVVRLQRTIDGGVVDARD
ncbi:tyrosine-type recombinase/integrase [Chitinasiproducens palmae]|uniref:Site-specific recombinase XerD n=1 Tax=Chitinasiproducens palmae TaxID=1770053 RepID=A0A1H2PIY7_9BURK|nr:tyrosine-type recombinase/integrase [Chitinasiproducens palmae]SDV46294.1 Site-specific recombinase XerD [Chitinasiproducens palmae]